MERKKRPLITLYTPGNRPDLIEKAARFEPDGIVIDFEDAVPLHLKAETRENVSKLLPSLNMLALVRVNSEPQFLEDDLKAVVSPYIYGIGLPMAESVEQVQNADRIITGLERELRFHAVRRREPIAGQRVVQRRRALLRRLAHRTREQK